MTSRGCLWYRGCWLFGNNWECDLHATMRLLEGPAAINNGRRDVEVQCYAESRRDVECKEERK